MQSIRSLTVRYVRDVRATPVQTLVFLMAVWFTSNGPIALAINPDFSMHPMHARTIHLLGIIPVTVNGWHALFHFVTGVAGLLCVRSRTAAIGYAAAAAAVYASVAVLCTTHATMLCPMAVDTFGNWVHLGEATILAAIAVYGANHKLEHLSAPRTVH